MNSSPSIVGRPRGIVRVVFTLFVSVKVNVRMDNETLWRMNVIVALVREVCVSSVGIMFLHVRV